MPVPSYQNITTLSSAASGLTPESMDERILSSLAMLASGKAPDGTTVSIGGGGGIGISVTSTGADPTGTSDCTLAIQQAIINASLQSPYFSQALIGQPQLPGNIVYVPPGRYLVGGVTNTLVANVGGSGNTGPVDGRLVMLPGVHLLGANSGASVIWLQNGANNDMFNTGNIDSAGNVYNTFYAYTNTNPNGGNGQTWTAGSVAGGTQITLSMANTQGMVGGGFVLITGTITGTDPSWGTNVNGTWRLISVTNNVSITFQVQNTVVGTWSSGGKAWAIPGCEGYVVENLTLHGNGNNNTKGTGNGGYIWKSFGYGMRMRDVSLFNGGAGSGTAPTDGGDLYTEGSGATSPYPPRSYVATPCLYDNVTSFGSFGHAFRLEGPHDGQFQHCIASSPNFHGFFIGNLAGGKGVAHILTNCHAAGAGTGHNGLYIDVNGGGTKITQSQFEGGQTNSATLTTPGNYQAILDANGTDWIGGAVYDAGAANACGIMIGNTQAVSGTNIQGVDLGLAGIAINVGLMFNSADAGPNIVYCNGNNITTSIFPDATHIPSSASRVRCIGSGGGVTTNSGNAVSPALMPGGSATIPASPTGNIRNLSGTDMMILLNVANCTVAGSITALTVAGMNVMPSGGSITIPINAGTTTVGPFYLAHSRNIAITYAFTATSFTWTGTGVGQ